MRVEDILLAMENKPKSVNRKSKNFVESVELALNKEQGIETDMNECRNFVLMAAIKGIYIDCDLGTLDTIGYITNAVIFKYMNSIPEVDFTGSENQILVGIEGLTGLADNALFVAGFLPNAGKRKGIGRDFFVFSGKESYRIASRLSESNTHHQRYKSLSDDFEHYADAMMHTSTTYFSN